MAILDTTVFLDLRNRKWKEIAAKVLFELRKQGDALSTTRVNVAELYVGIELSSDKAAEETAVLTALEDLPILELTEDAAREFGKMRAYLQKRGELVGDLDLLIAAIALSNGQSVVTRNVQHFGRIPALTVIGYG